MASGRLDDFFEKWTEEGFPEEGENCLPDFQLVEIARSDDPKTWPSHVNVHLKECKHCPEVIRLLRSSEHAPGKIYELLSRAQEKGRETGRERRPSVFSQAWSFFSFGQPKWMVPALAASLILLFVGWVVSDRFISPNENGAVVVSLGEDPYGNTTQLLSASLDKLQDASNMSLQEKRLQLKSLNDDVNEINKRLADIKKDSLLPTQRAQLANLVTEYNDRSLLIQQELASQRNSPAVQTSKISTTADSELVAKVYTTAYSSTSKKNAGGEDTPQTEAERAKAAQVGKNEVKVVSIQENEAEVQIQVLDLKPNRSPEDTVALQQSLQQTFNSPSNLRQVNLTLTPARAFTKVP